MEVKPLPLFATFVVAKGYRASFIDDTVIIFDVANPGNNFKVYKADGYHAIATINVSEADYEYTAKCIIYLLLAEFNKVNSAAHLHINYKVDL